MLNSEQLKSGLHSGLKQADKLLLLLSTFDRPCAVEEIKEESISSGFKIPKSWNVSARLKDAKGLAILTPKGWEITEAGKHHLRNLGYGAANPVSVHIASGLRSKLASINSQDTRAFVEEAIKCYEAELYRSAIVMSWLAAVDVLYNLVVRKHLAALNSECFQNRSKVA